MINDGFGKLIYPNGTIYKGNFLEGGKEGFVSFEFKNDELNDFGIIVNGKNEIIYEGNLGIM